MTQNYSDEANLVNNSLEAQYLKKISIVDNVTTNDSTLPLSAKQGKYLYDTFNSYKSTLVSKLNDLGVTNVSVNDTWSSLLNAIPASVGGIDVITAISCNVSNTNITVNEQITISGVLEADKDDTSSDNVDLEGYLKGATVKIYNGQTLIGTTTTDSNGAYSYNYTPTSEGTLSILALFEGTDDYEQCSSSSTTVTVTILKTLTLTSDKDILSYADNDSATLTATYKENGVGVANKNIIIGLPTCNYFSTTSNQSINSNLGSSFKLEFENVNEAVLIGSSNYGIRIQKIQGNVYVVLYANNQQVNQFTCDGYLTLKNGVLSDNSGHSVTISSYDNDFTLLSINNATVYVDCIGHDMTDNNGEISVSYASQGVGDISITATDGSFVSETYAIEDCRKVYNSFKGTDFTRTNNIYTSNDVFLDQSKVYMKFANFPNNFQLGVGEGSVNKLEFQQSPSYNVAYLYHGSSYESLSQKMTANTVLCFEINGTSGKFYYDDTLISTVTLDTSMANKIKAMVYSGNDFDVEYIKIKPL